MTVPQAIDYEMRHGSNPHPVMDAIEKQIAQAAYEKCLSEPYLTELGFKTVYNWMHLQTFYGSPSPDIQRLMYQIQPYPVYVEMEVTQWTCPLKCIMCEIQYDKREKPIQLSFDRFKYAMDMFPDLKWAGNNALGDPFTNTDYPKMVKYLDDKGVAQEIYLTSFLLNETDMKMFANLHEMIYTKFSFDAATKETYEKIRVNSNFDKVVRNIKALDRYKKQAGKFFPQIEFHYIIMKQNIHEAEAFIDFVDSLGIHCTGIMFSRLLHNFPEVKDVYTDIPQNLIDKLIEKGKQFGIPVSVNGDARTQKPPAYNCLQWSMPYIFPDGTVIPCCNPNEANMRYKQREWSMGNIFETPMREIWNGEKYKQLRNSLMLGNPNDYMPVCKNLCAIHDVGATKC